MKICPTHWNMLKDACRDRGMWHLVHQSGEAAAEALARQMQSGSEDSDDFDPLLHANMMIWVQALEMGGPYLMDSPSEGEHYCPICEVMKYTELPPSAAKRYASVEEFWTAGVMDALLDSARERGLVPRLS